MEKGKALLQDLCDLEIAGDVSFSPDGEWVLYSTSLSWGSQKGPNAVSSIWLASAAQAYSSRRLSSGLFKDCSPRWHPNGKEIAFVSDRAGAGAKWTIYTQPIEPTGSHKVKAITSIDNESAIEFFAYSPAGKAILCLSADEKTAEQKAKESSEGDVQVWNTNMAFTRLRTVDTSTSEVRTLTLEKHIMLACWSPTGESIAIVSRETTDYEESFMRGVTVSIVNRELTTVQQVCHVPTLISYLVWANEDKLYIRSGVPYGKNFAGYGVYAVESSELSKSPDHVVFGVDDDAFDLKNAGGQIVAKVEHGLEDRVVHLSGQVLYAKSQVIESFDVNYTSNDQIPKVAVATSDVNHPVEVYVTTDSGKSMLQLSNHGKRFEDWNFGICHHLSCSSTDGEVEFDSIYLQPVDRVSDGESSSTNGPFQTAVLIHGGPTTRLTNAFNSFYYMFVPYLLSLGIGVLIPNYRGSTSRGKKFASFSYGGVGVYDYADIIAATQFAIDKGLADSEKLIIGGWSNGGMLTNLCCVRNGLHGHGWKFKAAISGASIADIDSMALTSDLGGMYPTEIHMGGIIWNMDISDTRSRHASALWEFKNVMERSRSEGRSIIPPILILHGAEDRRCHVSQAWGLRRALEYYSLPFELAIYPRQGHFFHEQKSWIDMAFRVGKWCQSHI